MITLNGARIPLKHFMDGALDIKIDSTLLKTEGTNTIEWLFDVNEELVVLFFLTRHLQSKGLSDIELYMPYIPNARKDRAQREQDVFSLKYFSEIINSLQFKRVTVLDPHSVVSEALIDRISVITPEKYIFSVLEELNDATVLFYPDEGAVKRYSKTIGRGSVYGMKVRDTDTRAIDSLRIFGDVDRIEGSDILMVDDICASGDTLCIAARKLKELGAVNIFAYVSHCENTVLGSKLLSEITMLYTTESIFRGNDPKIRVMR